MPAEQLAPRPVLFQTTWSLRQTTRPAFARLLTLGVLLALAALVAVPVARAQSPNDVRVVDDAPVVHYAEEIVFRLVAEAPFPVRRALVTYRVGDGIPNTNRAEVTDSGPPVRAGYTLRVAGQGWPAPFTTIRYFFTLEGPDGERVTTPERSFDYQDTRFDWQTRRAGNITVYYYEDFAPEAERVLNAGRHTLDRLGAQTGLSLDRPVRVLIYDSLALVDEVAPFRSEATREQAGGYALPEHDLLVLLGTYPDIDRLTAHEFAHLLTAEQVGSDTASPFHDPLPTWLDEGLATYAEGETLLWHRSMLHAARQSNRLLSVKEMTLRPSRPADNALMYAQGQSLVQYLLEVHGPDKLAELLAAYQAGTTHDEAFRQVYGFDRAGLDARWRAWLRPPPLVQPLVPAANSAPALAPTGPLANPAGFALLGLVVIGAAIGWRRVRRTA